MLIFTIWDIWIKFLGKKVALLHFFNETRINCCRVLERQEELMELPLECWKSDFYRRRCPAKLPIDDSTKKRHHLNFDICLKGMKMFLQRRIPMVTVKTDHRHSEPLYLTNTYIAYTRWVFGDDQHRTRNLLVRSSVLWPLGYLGPYSNSCFT